MKKDYHSLIVNKSNTIEIGQFNDSNKYIVTHRELGNRIIINKKTLDVLNLVDGKTSLENIVSKYNKKNPSSELDVGIAYSLLFEKLGGVGIILNKNLILKKKEIASYLALSFTLVNKKVLVFFVKILSPIFLFNHFYKIFILSLGFVSFIVLSNYEQLINNIDSIKLGDWIFYLLTSGIILFLHEFGHATACKKLGAEPGTIGFGFYLLSPVMFADVSDIWKLKTKERVYVNFAGLYIEILIALLFAIVYYFTNHISLLIICSIILFSFVLNLNPFLRYDGYWILSDITNTPNLRKVSQQKLNSFFQFVLGKSKLNFSAKNIFLIIYAFISMVFIFVFLGSILLYDPNAILSFPIDLSLYIKIIIGQNKSFVLSDLTRFILPFLFYFILIKFIISFAFIHIRRKKS